MRKCSFCVRKCGDIACKLCKPVRMEKDLFDKSIRHLPDPIINPSDTEHYLPFSEAFGKETSEKDCPSLVNHKKKVLSYSPSIQHAKNTNVMVQCEECLMWRLVFSKKKLTLPQKKSLEKMLTIYAEHSLMN